MKKVFLFLMLPLLAFTFSCSKDNNGDDTGTTKLVKSITDGDGTTTYEYDSQSRISKFVWDDGHGYKQTYTVAYSSSLITVTSGNSGTEPFKYTLDNNGYVIKAEYDYEKYELTYSNGNLHTTTDKDGIVTTYTWSNGNLVERKNSSTTYTYSYNDKTNKLNVNDLVYLGCELKFKGTYTANYVASIVKNGHTETLEYTYDSDGYPTKITRTGYSPTTIIYY